jgi:hypothetical protein
MDTRIHPHTYTAITHASRHVHICAQVHNRGDDWNRVQGSGDNVSLGEGGALDARTSDGGDSIDLMVGAHAHLAIIRAMMSCSASKE